MNRSTREAWVFVALCVGALSVAGCGDPATSTARGDQLPELETAPDSTATQTTPTEPARETTELPETPTESVPVVGPETDITRLPASTYATSGDCEPAPPIGPHESPVVDYLADPFFENIETAVKETAENEAPDGAESDFVALATVRGSSGPVVFTAEVATVDSPEPEVLSIALTPFDLTIDETLHGESIDAARAWEFGCFSAGMIDVTTEGTQILVIGQISSDEVGVDELLGVNLRVTDWFPVSPTGVIGERKSATGRPPTVGGIVDGTVDEIRDQLG